MRSRSGNSTAERPSSRGAGRFAPSPTGPLHLGSLLAAAASYLDARARGLPWHVRMDDLDEPRNRPGAEREILLALERHGLHWDGTVVRQSERIPHYAKALASLEAQRLLYYCTCSRKDLAGRTTYPGTCRTKVHPVPDAAVRVRVDRVSVTFTDLLRGPQRDVLYRSTGDFVVRRRDGAVAYQLATAVDDGSPPITRVIRGRDLLENTPRQIFLMNRLGLSVPEYGHIPLILNAHGQKLSKQTGAAALDLNHPEQNLLRVLRVLGVAGVESPSESRSTTGSGSGGQAECERLLAASVPGWSLERVQADDLLTYP